MRNTSNLRVLWPFSALREKNPLQWPEAQGEREGLLPEMDGGASPEPD